MNDKPSRDDYWTAGIFCAWWLTIMLLTQCLGCSVAAAQSTADTMQPMICRISNTVNRSTNLGSGTLIDVTDDRSEGLVLTCAHLFTDGVGRVEVKFSDGQRHVARVIDTDREADLALLVIAKPQAAVAAVALEPLRQQTLYACGHGPQGRYRCARGKVVGQAQSPGQLNLMIGDPVRSGDSGGGVFDGQGRLVAVIWGVRDQVTYASYGGPLRRFLGRRLARFRQPGQQPIVQDSCAGGQCPIVRPPARQRPVVIQPWPDNGGQRAGEGRSSLPKALTPRNGKHSIVVDSRWAAYEKRLAALETRSDAAGPRGPAGPPGRDGADALIDQRAVIQAAAQAAAQILLQQQQQKPEAKEPFYIRVDRNAPYQAVLPGQYVTLPLRRVQP